MNLKDEFPQPDDLLFLNHAAVGVWPKRTTEAVKAFASENCTVGPKHYKRWTAKQYELKDQFRKLLNAESSDCISLQPSTSASLSCIAYGINWQAGDTVVITSHEFPSNRIVWESLQQYGVTVKIAELSLDADVPEKAVIDLIDRKTKLVSVSSVQYASGLKLNLKNIGHACKMHDALFCVDAIQSLGALHMDVQAIKADFVVADGHKWLLGPEGVGVFYCAPQQLSKLSLKQYGWHMVEDIGNYDNPNWRAAQSARRFECGSPNMLGIQALSASLSLHLELGMLAIEKQILRNTQHLLNGLASMSDVNILSAQKPQHYAGIVTFKHHKIANDALYDELARNDIIASCRGGGVRLSPHFYQTHEDLDKILNFINELA